MQKLLANKKMLGLLITGSVVVLFLIIYGIGTAFYQSHFLPNTTVAGISVSNQTVNHATARVDEQLKSKQLNLKEKEQTFGFVNLQDLQVSTQLSDNLTQIFTQQSAWNWPLALFGLQRVAYDAQDDDIIFSEQQLSTLLTQLGIDNATRQPSINAGIHYENNTFSITPEVYGKQITVSSIKKGLLTAINHQQTELDISNVYDQPTVKKEDDQLATKLSQAEKMLTAQITLTFDGHEVTIPQENIKSWLYVDENGEVQVDYDAVNDYVLHLNYDYAGLSNSRQFQSTYQGEVTVQPGTYGWYIDRPTETDKIIEEIKNGVTVTRQPDILGSGYGMGDDVGGDYVEVDIANQMMLVYLDYVLVYQTPIVTGRIGTNTIPGAYQIWNMETPSVLTGYNPHTNVEYEQPVSYWVAFDDQAQGIHDANWQSAFGGTQYLEHGSLGCVNTPPSVMGDIFSLVYIGMPVIIF